VIPWDTCVDPKEGRGSIVMPERFPAAAPLELRRALIVWREAGEAEHAPIETRHAR